MNGHSNNIFECEQMADVGSQNRRPQNDGIMDSDLTHDFISYEQNRVRENFSLEEALSFELEYRLEVIRGEDHQYVCYIDGKGYAVGLTAMSALTFGIAMYKRKNQ